MTATHESSQSLESRGGSELQVYNLTFYSRKIGLQLQKIPPPPVKAKGLLTEAMTSDLARVSDGGGKTSAELRRIAAFASRGATNTMGEGQEDTCDVAMPVDAVLVCGFNGLMTPDRMCAQSLALDWLLLMEFRSRLENGHSMAFGNPSRPAHIPYL